MFSGSMSVTTVLVFHSFSLVLEVPQDLRHVSSTFDREASRRNGLQMLLKVLLLSAGLSPSSPSPGLLWWTLPSVAALISDVSPWTGSLTLVQVRGLEEEERSCLHIRCSGLLW